MKEEFVKIMNQHYWSEISEEEAYNALLNLFSVGVTLVCPNGCGVGFNKLKDNFDECKKCGYLEQTN